MIYSGDKAVSFDIFDTLIVRDLYAPTDLFLYVEHKSKKAGFAKQRRLTEALLRVKFRREITFDEIYEHIPDQYKPLKEEELMAEEIFCSCNSDIKPQFERYKKDGYKIVCTSDMYLPSSFLLSLLEKNGFSGIDKIFVSCEYNKTKYSGSLFKEVCKALNIKPNQLTHIGDNWHSDYFVPSHLGITSVHYQTPKRLFCAKHRYIKKFYKKHPDLGHSVIANIIATKGCENADLESFGFNIAGVMVLSYSMFVAKVCKDKSFDLAMLLARDGYYIQKCLDIFTPDLRTVYVYAPRQQYWLTHYDTDFRGIVSVPRGITSYFGKKCFFNNLYIRTHRAQMEVFLNKEREKWGYREYLMNKMGNTRFACIVDGPSGSRTSQKFIQKELNKTIPTIYVQCLPHVNEKNIPAINFLKFPKFLIQNRLKRSQLIEKVFTSPYESAEFIDKYGNIKFFDHRYDVGRKEKYQELEKGMYEFFNQIAKYRDITDVFSKSTVFEDILTSFSSSDRANYNKIFRILRQNQWYLFTHKGN